MIEEKTKKSIENIYEVFSKYPFNSEIEGCPCCVNQEHRNLLVSKPLRELGNREIRRYAFKAMTTWGLETDYKYYLPRILELSVQNKIGNGEHILFGKFDYANWLEWEKDELVAIKNFLYTWWEFHLKGDDYLNAFLMVEILNRLRDDNKLMNLWILSAENKSLENFIEFISNGKFSGIKDRSSFYDGLNNNSRLALNQWVNNGISYLRKYNLREKNNQFSEQIEEALRIYELYE